MSGYTDRAPDGRYLREDDELPSCCAGEGYPGIAHDLLTARTRVETLTAALREASEVIHAEGYDDPEDKLRSLREAEASAEGANPA